MKQGELEGAITALTAYDVRQEMANFRELFHEFRKETQERFAKLEERQKVAEKIWKERLAWIAISVTSWGITIGMLIGRVL